MEGGGSWGLWASPGGPAEGPVAAVPPPLQGKAMLLVLEEELLKVLDPQKRTELHCLPIAAIRVWGVGRDSGR